MANEEKRFGQKKTYQIAIAKGKFIIDCRTRFWKPLPVQPISLLQFCTFISKFSISYSALHNLFFGRTKTPNFYGCISEGSRGQDSVQRSSIDMDWGSVTAEDLIDALREVDWSSPPRPLSEFFSRFTLPRSYAKWSSRLKCNLYYYRTNYFLLIVFILGLGFLRRPLAIVAASLSALSIALLNDSFAGTFSEKVTRTVRQFSPHLAAKMRPPLTPVIRGRPSAKRSIYICGRPRGVFVFAFAAVSLFIWFVSCGLLTVLWALAFGLLATILHASIRTPNLKARLNTYREEFRAVWRNYSEL